MAALFVLFAVGVVAIGLVAYYNSETMKIRRALRSAARVSAAEFPDGGEGKLVGRLEILGEPLIAPLSQRPCAYYELTVEQQRSSGKSSHWYTLFREVNGQPFGLDDSSDCRVIVDPRGARVSLVVDAHTKSGTFDDATPVEEELLRRHGHESRGWIFNKTLRYREGVLEGGELVAVLGRGIREPDPDAVGMSRGYRDLPATRLRVSGSRDLPILISDEYEALGQLPASRQLRG